MKRQILFLCTGNSCRSQMAEGIVNHYLGDTWHASSAGVEPADYIHPLAIQVMKEIGIDISQNFSKSVNIFRNNEFDDIVTVCDGAAKNCPAWLGKGQNTHIGFDDPAYATGSVEERLSVFRRVRDEIRIEILKFPPERRGQANRFHSVEPYTKVNTRK